MFVTALTVLRRPRPWALIVWTGTAISTGVVARLTSDFAEGWYAFIALCWLVGVGGIWQLRTSATQRSPAGAPRADRGFDRLHRAAVSDLGVDSSPLAPWKF
jgi:hypothetical protein